jgi:hypothetical protein
MASRSLMRTATRSRARESRRRTSWTRRSAPRMAPSSTTTSPCSCRASRPQLPSSSGFATRATAAASSTRAAGPPCPRTSSSLLRRLRLRRARHLFSYGRVAQPRVAARPSRQARLHTQVGRAPDRDGQRDGQDGDVLPRHGHALAQSGRRWGRAASSRHAPTAVRRSRGRAGEGQARALSDRGAGEAATPVRAFRMNRRTSVQNPFIVASATARQLTLWM